MAPASRIVVAGSERTLVDQIVDHYAARIDERLLRAGHKMPSIRRFAGEHRVSRFTVVEAYDRLIARGYIEARPGSGFYVKARDVASHLAQARTWAEAPNRSVDVVWLLRNMFRQLPAADMPGGGVLPPDWLDAELVAASLRSLGRQKGSALLGYGHAQGYLPLRQQLQLKLAQLEIAATPEQIVTTNGVTQALDLVAQHFVRPGDTILVDDPGWFLMFGRFALLGARVVGVPRQADGPDLERLAALAELYRPKLLVTSSVLHNPTGTSLSAARAFGLLQLAERHDFRIVEDDVYCDMHPGPSIQPATRVASLDQLRRVIYLGSFSKTLAANLRVGFIACEPALARDLTDLKMLIGLTSSELGERVVYRVLSEGHYRRHLERLRQRLALVREQGATILDGLGCRRFAGTSHGMFHWVDTGVDSVALAQAMRERGFLMAPGSLFSPIQAPSTWMRFNVTTLDNPKMTAALAEALAALGAAGRHERRTAAIRPAADRSPDD
ncbi:MAG: PLP-dependent aminotransferase family protein [Lautropia sp.]